MAVVGQHFSMKRVLEVPFWKRPCREDCDSATSSATFRPMWYVPLSPSVRETGSYTLQVFSISALYSGGSGFRSRSGDPLSLLRSLTVFLNLSRQITGCHYKIDNDRFIQHHLHFIIHWTSNNLMLYIMKYRPSFNCIQNFCTFPENCFWTSYSLSVSLNTYWSKMQQGTRRSLDSPVAETVPRCCVYCHQVAATLTFL
jgi:hypothetical protein